MVASGYNGGQRQGTVQRWSSRPLLLPERGWPTICPPGTVEKVAVFHERARRKEPLFHPFDAKYDGCLRPLVFQLMEPGERDGFIAGHLDPKQFVEVVDPLMPRRAKRYNTEVWDDEDDPAPDVTLDAHDEPLVLIHLPISDDPDGE